MIRMKNSRTGEFRDVDDPSPELAALKEEVHDDGQGGTVPAWEKVGESPSRFQDEGIHPNDLGNVRPEPHPERALSAAELEAGITSWEQKQYELGLGPKPQDLEEGDEDEYGGMGRDELRDLAEKRGLEVPSRVTKAQLITQLKDQDASSRGASPEVDVSPEPEGSPTGGIEPDTEEEEGGEGDAG